MEEYKTDISEQEYDPEYGTSADDMTGWDILCMTVSAVILCVVVLILT